MILTGVISRGHFEEDETFRVHKIGDFMRFRMVPGTCVFRENTSNQPSKIRVFMCVCAPTTLPGVIQLTYERTHNQLMCAPTTFLVGVNTHKMNDTNTHNYAEQHPQHYLYDFSFFAKSTHLLHTHNYPSLRVFFKVHTILQTPTTTMKMVFFSKSTHLLHTHNTHHTMCLPEANQ